MPTDSSLFLKNLSTQDLQRLTETQTVMHRVDQEVSGQLPIWTSQSLDPRNWSKAPGPSRTYHSCTSDQWASLLQVGCFRPCKVGCFRPLPDSVNYNSHSASKHNHPLRPQQFHDTQKGPIVTLWDTDSNCNNWSMRGFLRHRHQLQELNQEAKALLSPLGRRYG